MVIALSLSVARSALLGLIRVLNEFLGLHLVIENLRLARLGLGDEMLVQHVEHILAHLLELGLDLLAVVTNGANVLIRALGLLFLFDG